MSNLYIADIIRRMRVLEAIQRYEEQLYLETSDLLRAEATELASRRRASRQARHSLRNINELRYRPYQPTGRRPRSPQYPPPAEVPQEQTPRSPVTRSSPESPEPETTLPTESVSRSPIPQSPQHHTQAAEIDTRPWYSTPIKSESSARYFGIEPEMPVATETAIRYFGMPAPRTATQQTQMRGFSRIGGPSDAMVELQPAGCTCDSCQPDSMVSACMCDAGEVDTASCPELY